MAGKKISRNAQRLLTVREVLHARDGDHADGGGLYARIRDASAIWFLRYTASSGKRREMGLGPVDRRSAAATGESIEKAREDAAAARRLLATGQDPIDARSTARNAERVDLAAKKCEAKAATLTLARASRQYHEKFIEPHRSDKHGAQWIASLENHMPAELWSKPIADVTAGELLDVLLDLYAVVPETASRIRQRLDAIFDDAILRGQAATNPAAAIRRKLKDAGRRKKPEHFRSLPYSKAPEFMSALKLQAGGAAIALRLLMLTASRTSEILLATRDEFDVDGRTWKIAGRRMKGGEDHVVHLSKPALELVELQLADKSNATAWLFPSPTGSDQALSNMSLLELLKRMKAQQLTTAHGLRATFSTWANESGRYRNDVIEACLAHREADKVRAAYNRAQFAAERRQLLEDWALFCLPAIPIVSADEILKPRPDVEVASRLHSLEATVKGPTTIRATTDA